MYKQEILLKTYGTPLDVKVFMDILKEQGTLIYLKGCSPRDMRVIKHSKKSNDQFEVVLTLKISINLKDFLHDENKELNTFKVEKSSVSLSYLSKLLNLRFDIRTIEGCKQVFIVNGDETNEL